MSRAPLLILRRCVRSTTGRGHLYGPRQGLRHASSNSSSETGSTRWPMISGGVLLTLGVGLSPFYLSSLHADAAPAQSVQGEPNVSLRSLVRSYIVYTMCSFPTLVDNSPRILEILTSIPGVKQITEAAVRVTFFDQFVGGDTAHHTVPLLHTLRASNKGALFAYSVEVDENEALASSTTSAFKEAKPHKRIVNEMIRCIDVAADFEDGQGQKSSRGRRTWVAIKMTALLPNAQALINLSSHILTTRPQPNSPSSYIAFPGSPHSSDLDILSSSSPSSSLGHLRNEDITSLRELHADLVRICTRAQERGVKVVIDAEYSWYQPAIEALTLSLMREFNKLSPKESGDVQPLVYGTFQAYLRRTPKHLAQSIRDAKKHNYALGVKLVRGAYHPYEIAAHQPHSPASASLSISPDALPPVWATKAETDKCYNDCAKMIIEAIAEDVATSASSVGRSSNSTLSASTVSSGWTSVAGSWSEAVSGFIYRSSSPSGAVSNSIASNVSLPSSPTSIKAPTIAVLFGTHNWESCRLILRELVRTGLAISEPVSSDIQGEGDFESVIRINDEVTERVTLGQLFGMSDGLTDYLVRRTRSSTPLIVKYVPYGALSEVMPYLSRRAIENKSVLGDGGAIAERRQAGAAIWRKIVG